jgi:cystathionine beta-lyase
MADNALDIVINRRDSDSSKWGRYGADVLPLWDADMDFHAPEPVTRALRERVEHGILGYPLEHPELRPVVVERLERLYGWQVEPEALVFVPGVVVAFNLAIQAVASQGDGVLVQTPVYFPMLYAPDYAGCTLDEMELTEGLDGQYEIDFDLFEQAISERTRTFLLCNPHNPVGRVFRRDELERMAEICLRHNVVICSDEIHCDLVFPGHQHVPIATLSPEVEAQTITLLAPSKTFNIAGMHCSVAIIPNAELRKRYEIAKRGITPRVGLLDQVAGMAAYRDGQPWLDEILAYLEANRDFLVQWVGDNLPGISMLKPEGTYLGWLDCRKAGIPGSCYKFFLEQAKVALNDGSAFGQGGAGFVRINFACPRSTLEEALDKMRNALDTL